MLTLTYFVDQNNLDPNEEIVLSWICTRSKHPTSDVPTYPATGSVEAEVREVSTLGTNRDWRMPSFIAFT